MAPTIGLVILTAAAGVSLLKKQGLATVTTIQQKAARGEIPGIELLEGAMLLIGGALLLTPGFVTDALGFSLLFPSSRKVMARILLHHGVLNHFSAVSGNHFSNQSQNTSQQSQGNPTQFSKTIEGEFRREDEP